MIALNRRTKIFVSKEPTDMRASYDSLFSRVKNTLEKDPLPVQVTETDPLKILILSSTPDFENRFLNNRLSKKGYEIVNILINR